MLEFSLVFGLMLVGTLSELRLLKLLNLSALTEYFGFTKHLENWTYLRSFSK